MSRVQLAQQVYEAFAAGNRDAIERLLSDDFAFHAPPDPNLDRAGYFERCWPHSGVTYEAMRPDGSRFRNTEVLTFDGDRVRRAEVYFGWDLS